MLDGSSLFSPALPLQSLGFLSVLLHWVWLYEAGSWLDRTSLERAVIWVLCAKHWRDSQIMIKTRNKSYVVTPAGKNTRRLMIILLLIDPIKFCLLQGKQRSVSSFQAGACSLHGSCRQFVSSELLRAHSVTTQKQEFRSPQYALRPPSTSLFCCRKVLL